VTRPPDLNPAERRLCDAYPAGTWVVLGADRPAEPLAGRVVRAGVISALLLGAVERRPGAVPAVRLRGAYVTGQLDVAGGVVESELRLEHCRLAESPRFQNTQTRQVRMSDCQMPGLEGGGWRADGYVSLSGSMIDGEVRLPRAQISGGLRMNKTRITETDPAKWAIYSGGLVVDVGTFLRGAEFTGGVRLVGARMSGGLFLEGAILSNPGRIALDAQNIVVGDAAELSRGFTAEGLVRLRNARISGTLSFDGAVLRSPGGGALQASHVQVDELILSPSEPVQGWVSLAYSRIGVILDRKESWPADLNLNGLTYDSLRGCHPRDRLAWVAQDTGRQDPSIPGEAVHPQPFEQLAEWYRRIGHDQLARRAQLTKLRTIRPHLRWQGRIWSYLLDVTVGHGYRPWLASMWLAFLLAVGTVVFTIKEPRPLKPPGEQPAFHAFIYTLDLLIPLSTFGHRELFDPAGWTAWLAYGLIACGWILATALIAGATRVLRPS
jgi:hypothetical protein